MTTRALPEGRCAHGFLLSQVTCPECTPSTRSVNLRGRARIWSDSEIETALASERSIRAAARSIGMSNSGLIMRAEQVPRLRKLLDLKRAPKSGARSHPWLVNLVGQRLAGCRITARAANQGNGRNAAWDCVAACGHPLVVQGIYLRAVAKEGREIRCSDCRAKRVLSFEAMDRAREQGRLGGLKGGAARARSMSSTQRTESARLAANARWIAVRKASR